jgi:hypothetical protein
MTTRSERLKRKNERHVMGFADPTIGTWNPIDTAIKIGGLSDILGIDESYEMYVMNWWWAGSYWVKGGLKVNPTHWMPLPKLPEPPK